MPFCPRDSVHKLSAEMIKISNRVENIKCMTLDELTKEVIYQHEVKQSKSNFFIDGRL